ncbi:MAG: cytidylate kinase-like family protein [Clostridia bacterium]|nr:cytidylate kinase-like family protein [Clostridia bacterium]
MDKQIIITIGREYGSAGHFIAEKLAEKLGIKLYDRLFIENSSEEIGYSREIMEKYDEKPVNVLAYKKIGNHSNSIELNVQEKVAEFIRSKADKGESFVVVGRCSDEIFRHNKNAIHIFIMGDYEEKLHRIMTLYKLSEAKAKEKIKKHDKKRKAYHNRYSSVKWGDSRGYHLCINSSAAGIDNTVDILCDYIMCFDKNRNII